MFRIEKTIAFVFDDKHSFVIQKSALAFFMNKYIKECITCDWAPLTNYIFLQNS